MLVPDLEMESRVYVLFIAIWKLWSLKSVSDWEVETLVYILLITIIYVKFEASVCARFLYFGVCGVFILLFLEYKRQVQGKQWYMMMAMGMLMVLTVIVF